MSNVSKEQWIEWKSHPVTRALKEASKERIEEIKDQIVASTDPDYDRFLKGMIWAYNEVSQAKPDLIDEGDLEDEVQAGDVSLPGYT